MQRRRRLVESGCDGGSADATFDLRAVIVASGTGHLPMEFWSSLEFKVGCLVIVSRSRFQGEIRTGTSGLEIGGFHTGKAAYCRM